MQEIQKNNVQAGIIQVEHEQTIYSEQCLDPLKDGISSIELIRVSGSDLDVVNAARVSYGKHATELSDRDAKLIRFLMEHNHTSPFEHNQLSFKVKLPIYVMRQWIRHRMNSYNEISYRYVKSELEFYIPAQWRYQDKHNKQISAGAFDNEQLVEQYKAAIKASVDSYEALLAGGVGRELARGVLPVCTYTEMIFTCNLHSLIHFLKLRLHIGAQEEIKVYAKAMLKLALPHFPASLGAWRDCHMPELDLNT